MYVIVASFKKLPCLTPTEPRSLFNFFVILSAGADPGFLEKGVHMYKGVGFRFADLSHFSYKSHENYFIFVGYLKTGGGGGGRGWFPWPSSGPATGLESIFSLATCKI